MRGLSALERDLLQRYTLPVHLRGGPWFAEDEHDERAIASFALAARGLAVFAVESNETPYGVNECIVFHATALGRLILAVHLGDVSP